MNLKRSIKPSDLRSQIASRLRSAAEVIGETVANRTTEEVRKRIPAKGGWYNIYRNAINYKNNGLRWRVDGLAEINFSEIPAATSLIEFSGEDQVGLVMEPYNPWPLDIIPPISGGYRDTIITKLAAEGAVEEERNRILPLMEIIKQGLITEGAVLEDESALLRINGRVYADIAHMARNVELGYSGYPHIRHWSIAIAKLRSDMGKWLSRNESSDQVNKIIGGGRS